MFVFACKDTEKNANGMTPYCQMLILFHLLHASHLFTDHSQRGAVGSEDAVQTLCLLGGVVGIGVAHLPLLMLRNGEAAPTPEVATSKLTTLLSIVGNE